MRSRRTKTPTLTFKDAIKVWMLRWQGLYQHAIAAQFGVNQGRISEILTGKKHAGSEAAARLAK